MENNLNMVM